MHRNGAGSKGAKQPDEKTVVPGVTPRRESPSAVRFAIEAWDVNCPQHIPQKIDAADAGAAIARLEAEVAKLEAENEALRQAKARA